MNALVPYTVANLKHYKNGSCKLVRIGSIKWFAEPMRTVLVHREGTYQPIKYEPFNPGSRDHIRKWMAEDYGYSFPFYTPTGVSKVDVDSLGNMTHPAGKMLKRYLKVSKDQSQVGEGKGSLLKNCNIQTSTVNSRTDTNGTVTGRFTSSSINMAQIPAQREFRELFSAPPGWAFIGTDFAGQENVNLAEMLYPYDGGRLANIIAKGDKDAGTDLHSLNAKACNITRSNAKPLWFGFLYGSSPTLTGYTLLGTGSFTEYTTKQFTAMKAKLSRRIIKQNGLALYPIKKDMIVPFNDHLVVQALFGAKVQADLISSTEGLKDLIRDLTAQAKRDGYVTMFGGRRVPIRHAHATLNSQLQGMGAEAMKHYLVFYHATARKQGLMHGYDFKQQACIYDEVDLIAPQHRKLEIADILQSTYAEVSDHLGMQVPYTGEVLIGGHSVARRKDGSTYIIDNSWHGCH